MPAGLWKSVPGTAGDAPTLLNAALDFAHAGQVLVQLALIGLGDFVANAAGIVEYVVDDALAIKVAIGDGGLRQAVAPFREQAVKNDFGVHLVCRGRGRRSPGDMRLVRAAVSKRIAGSSGFAAQLEAGKTRRVADESRVELVGGNADANGVLRLEGLGARQKARGSLAVAAPFGVAVGERRVVCQSVKAIEVVAGKRKRLEASPASRSAVPPAWETMSADEHRWERTRNTSAPAAELKSWPLEQTPGDSPSTEEREQPPYREASFGG